MDDWKPILVELAKKLTPPLAFAVLFVAAPGWFGGQIPADYVTLVYAVGLGVPLLWQEDALNLPAEGGPR